LDNDHGHGITQLHDLIDEDLDVVNAGGRELEVAEHVGQHRHLGRVAELELRGILPDHRAVRGDHADRLRELADAGAPAVHDEQTGCGDRHLRDADHVDDPHEDQVAGDFLADVFTKERALEIRDDAIRSHVSPARFQSPIRRSKL
jgi:hypothetical protein